MARSHERGEERLIGAASGLTDDGHSKHSRVVSVDVTDKKRKKKDNMVTKIERQDATGRVRTSSIHR